MEPGEGAAGAAEYARAGRVSGESVVSDEATRVLVAREEPEDWLLSDFDDSDWEPAAELPERGRGDAYR
jgi:hypothetical protein